jgi:S1-C subfamily serine protease
MALKRHHKWVIGSFSSIVIILVILNSVLLYSLFIKQTLDYNSLDQRITDTQSNINILAENLIQTKESLKSLDIQLGSVSQEMDLLKASAGEDFSGIIEDVIKSVVTIRTDVGQGTGFIISREGYIVTNAHVLSGGSKINAITYEQEIIKANFIGYDGTLDIALLKIPGDYSKLVFANSDEVQIGEKVIAIGNPLGFQFSVSEGIVSAVHRQGINKIEAYIQTDAALNPGNSGGPLINKQGEVIGINNFKVGSGESLGFALESNYIKDVLNEIAQEALNEILI